MNERELARRAAALPARFADRLGGELFMIDAHADGGEFEVMLSDLLATLQQGRASITRAEYAELEALTRALGVSQRLLRQLPIR